MKKFTLMAVLAAAFLLIGSPQYGWGQIISQYVETNSGSVPKGVEIWNNTASTLDFATTNLLIQQGTNGGTPSTQVTINTGTLASGAVMVVGTSDMGTYLTGQGLTSVTFVTKAFTFNGNDALQLVYGSTITDIFGTPGVDPGAAWTGGTVSTANQNIALLDGITTGATAAWTDPSLRFSTISTTPATLPAGLSGFGIAPLGAIPTLSFTPTSLSGFTYEQGNGPSTSQSYALSGTNLTGYPGDITVTGTNYEVSTDNSTFSGSVTVPFTDATLSSVTLYARLKAGLSAGSYNENLVHSGGGATNNLACNGSVSSPNPYITVGAVSAFANTQMYVISAEQSYAVTGANLTGNITVTPPDGFQISTGTGASFVPTNPVILTPTAGAVSATIYVRFAPTAAQSYTGNITHASNGATTQNVAVSGTGLLTIDVATVAELRAGTPSGPVYRLTGEAVVTYQRPDGQRNQMYVQDATAAIVVDDLPIKITTDYNIGDGVTGLIGTLSNYYNLIQFSPIADPGAPTSTGNTVIPEVKTLASLTSTDQAKLVYISQVTHSTPSGSYTSGVNYTVTDPSGSGQLRAGFAEADYIGTTIPASPQNYIALVGQYQTTMQFTPRFLSDITPFLPSWTSGYPKAEGATQSSFLAKVNLDVPSTAYFVVLPNGAAAPTAQQVKDGQDATGTAVAANLAGNIACAAGNTEYVSSVSGLTASTTYNVYFVAEAYGNLQAAPVVVSVTTSTSTTAPVVISPTAASITESSAVLGGNVSSDGGSPITERGTVWSTTSPVTIADNKLAEGTASTGLFSHLRSSLPAGVQIYYAAYATNANGTTLSTEASFYTFASEPTNHATDFTAGTTTMSAIPLTWTDAAGTVPPVAYLIKGSTTGYDAITDPVDGLPEANAALVQNVNQGVGNYTFTGLTVGTTYYFKIYPYTGSSSTINYKTGAPVPQVTAATQGAGIYTWNGGNGVWTVSTNWTPERSTPGVNDILQFSDGGTDTITGLIAETIGQLVISNNTTVYLQASAATVLTIGGLASGADLVVAAGSNLNVIGTGAITIALSSGASGNIFGNMSMSSTASTAHRLTGYAASPIVFNSGSGFTCGLFMSGSVFGTTSLNSVIFTSGSTFYHQGGSNPFGASGTNSVVVFQTGSLYKAIGAVTPSLSGRTYADVEYAFNSIFNQSGGSAVSMDNLTVTLGTVNFNVTGTPGHKIKGNITVALGARLNFAPASPATVKLLGTTTQTISGAGKITSTANSTLDFDNAAGFVINNDSITLSGVMQLTNGLVNLGSHNLTIGSTGTITGTPSVTNMIVATGTGELRKVFTGTGSFTYPVGDIDGTAEYTPATLNFTAGTFTNAYAGIRLTDDVYPGVTGNHITRYWNVSSSGITDYSCDAAFNYTTADVVGDENSIVCVRMLPATNFAAANTTLHQLTASGITAFGAFTGKDAFAAGKTLTLKLMLEGLYAGGGMMNQAYDDLGPHFGAGIADQITVKLYNAGGLVASYSNIDLMTDGTANITVDAGLSGDYYIGVVHRNSIETATASMISFAGSTIAYDFTTGAGQAFGNNEKDLGSGVFGFFAGDENQDGLVESGDMIDVDNAVALFNAGYIVTDVNGDGLMDSSDMIIIDNNNAAFVGAVLPY